ncbi:MAG: beta-ketoacyl-ACP synthase III [Bacteroidales bacterium]
MKIIGTGSALPSLSVTNDMLAQFLDTSDDWIRARTGIAQRRILSTESLIDLAVKSAKQAILDAGMEAKDIDFLFCSNVVNNYVTPALSCIIQGEIEATCPCIDLNGACSGFIYALDMAEAYLATGRAKNILIVCAEEPSRIVDWTERNTSILFGDGAAAVVLTAEGDSLKSMHLSTSSKLEPLYYQRKLEYNPYVNKKEEGAPLVMNGKDVYKLAVSASLSDIKTVLNKANIKADEVDFYLLHQANIRIIETIRQNLNQQEDKFPHNIEYYGNTSSASIPILLDEMSRSNKLNNGDLLVFSAFGAGFTTGACVLIWSKDKKKKYD